jgi:hypothetical protein
MNSSGNNVADLIKEILILNKKIEELMKLCINHGIDQEKIFRILQHNYSKQISNNAKFRNEMLAMRAKIAKNELNAKAKKRAELKEMYNLTNANLNEFDEIDRKREQNAIRKEMLEQMMAKNAKEAQKEAKGRASKNNQRQPANHQSRGYTPQQLANIARILMKKREYNPENDPMYN